MQSDADTHETPESNAIGAWRFGVRRMLHRVPFHRSASVPLTCVPAWLSGLPTAMQAELDVHETPSNMLPATPGSFGVDKILHRLPFHRSASVTTVPDLSK